MRAWKALVNLLVRKKVGGDSVYGISFNIGAAQWEWRFFSWTLDIGASTKSPIGIFSPKCFHLGKCNSSTEEHLRKQKNK
jgi:hypothetical protein